VPRRRLGEEPLKSMCFAEKGERVPGPLGPECRPQLLRSVSVSAVVDVDEVEVEVEADSEAGESPLTASLVSSSISSSSSSIC